MNNIYQKRTLLWRLLLAVSLVTVFFMSRAHAAECDCAEQPNPESHARAATHQGYAHQADSWVFARSRYTHDPATGARVSQYQRMAPIEPLPDRRLVTSGYRRTRNVLRGADGSSDTTYQVQSYGNGRGGLDAEWERFHDAWRGSTVAGGEFYQNGNPWGFGYPGFGIQGYGQPGYGMPGYGMPGYGPAGRFAPGQGYGPRTGRPDAGRLDPDATDGYRDHRPRTPDRRFFNPSLPPFVDRDTDEE
ncbi:MAG: hypothetical protein MKZ95_04865 [Pirellulales bacterium]|nr:hypothetical protein [Pirellulales bacterium]